MKIKFSLLLKWCTCKLTNKEYEFLIFITRYQEQDGYGHVRGVYYKEIMKKCNMSQMTFYTVLRSLKQKDLIEYTRRNKDYDITILNNDFSYEGSKEGYINLNNIDFEEEKFKNLRVNEKILFMIFMRNTYVNKGIYRIGTKTFYDEYTKLLGVTKKVLRSYLHALKVFFNIWTKEGKYFISGPMLSRWTTSKGSCYEYGYALSKDKIFTYQDNFSDWIKVSQKPPEEKAPVMAWCLWNGKWQTQTCYLTEGEWFTDIGNHWVSVLAWQPLPYKYGYSS